MVNTALTPIAVPSALSSDGSSFTVAAYPAAASERK
jgi:hypothetical protein